MFVAWHAIIQPRPKEMFGDLFLANGKMNPDDDAGAQAL
jgi:hypothetical protein